MGCGLLELDQLVALLPFNLIIFDLFHSCTFNHFSMIAWIPMLIDLQNAHVNEVQLFVCKHIIAVVHVLVSSYLNGLLKQAFGNLSGVVE